MIIARTRTSLPRAMTTRRSSRNGASHAARSAPLGCSTDTRSSRQPRSGMPKDGCGLLGHSITVGNAPSNGNDPSAGTEIRQDSVPRVTHTGSPAAPGTCASAKPRSAARTTQVTSRGDPSRFLRMAGSSRANQRCRVGVTSKSGAITSRKIPSSTDDCAYPSTDARRLTASPRRAHGEHARPPHRGTMLRP